MSDCDWLGLLEGYRPAFKGNYQALIQIVKGDGVFHD